MKVISPRILSKENSILLNYLIDIRDRSIQKDRAVFRRNIEKIGEMMAYEISKELNFEETEVETVLGCKKTQRLVRNPVVLSILRAGLPLHQGFMNVFTQADQGFIGAARKATEGNLFEIDLSYVGAPSLEGQDVIICDPMLATGRSVVKTIEALHRHGKPQKIILASVIASEAGVAYVQEQLPYVDIWLADLDPILNDKSYIVPGLGDAGDLAFGPKI